MIRGIKLEERLAKLTGEDIKGVAALWHLEDVDKSVEGENTRRKKDLIKFVAKGIREKVRIKDVVHSLSDREKQISGIFALNNWFLDAMNLYRWDIDEAELGTYPYNVSPYSYSPFYSERTKDGSEGLLGLLLLVKVRRQGSYGPITYLVPREFRGAINAEFTAEQKTEVAVKEHDAIKSRTYAGYAVLDDLLLFLSYAADGIVLTPSLREIPKRTADKIMKLLKEQTRDRINFLLAISNALNLVQETLRAEKPVLIATERVEPFLMQSRDARVMNVLAEFSRHYDRLDKMILEELKQLEAEVWYDRALFHKKIQNTLFLRKSRDWFAMNHESMAKIFSHLRQLGLLEVGRDKEKNGEFFRLKSSFFGIREELAERERGIIVQPNFELVALPETPEDVVFRLSRYSELKSADKVHIFLLTKKSLLHAIDNGMKADALIELLQDNAKTDIPQNVLYSIEEWGALYGRVALKKGVFLDADPELMQVITTKLKEHLIREISDSSVIIDKEGLISSLIKEEEGVFLEAGDEIVAAEVEKAVGNYVLRRPSTQIFVIEAEAMEKCRTALKKKGLFPEDFLLEKAEERDTHVVTEVPSLVVSSPQDKRALIEDAIEMEKRIRVLYLSRGFRETERVIVPYNVNDRYVEGYCHTRNERRMFRLDRITRAEMIEEQESELAFYSRSHMSQM